MRARLPLAAAFALLMLAPALPVQGSHDQWVPYMHLLAQQVPAGEIRPGAWMSAPHNCTMAFVVRDAAQRLYITTAAHCVDYVGQQVDLWPMGRIGEVVAMDGPDVGRRDTALVAIDADKYDKVNPTMVGWGGPTGLVEGDVAENAPLLHHGWGYLGTFVAEQTRCRVHAFQEFTVNGADYEAIGHISSGDSGSPILTADGKALGLTNWGFVLFLAPMERFGGPTFAAGLRNLEAITGLDLELVPGGPVQPVCLTV